MKKIIMLLLLLVLVPAGRGQAWARISSGEDALDFGRFGRVTLYRNSPDPAHVVLFVSGDGGWNLGVVDMARTLAGLDALVVGIDITRYLKALGAAPEPCVYPAADFETLSQYVQKKLEFARYIPPVLVGYSSGATLVYAVLAQAPPNTFRAAVSMGFCPDLPMNKPFCKGTALEWKAGPKGKGVSFLPAPALQSPWIVFQGTIDQVCDARAVEDYVKQVGHGRVVLLPKVGHGFSVQRNWMPQFKDVFADLAKTDDRVSTPHEETLKDLPLVEVPAKGKEADMFAIIISGDGGWASLDREVGQVLAARGIPVVGLNSLQYFWKARTPDQAAKDLGRILDHYLGKWQKSKALLVGYSRGADVLPFMAGRLSQDRLSRVALVALVGPALEVSFEIHLSDWLGGRQAEDVLPIRPELTRLKGTRVLCVYGSEENESLCHDLGPDIGWVKAMELQGGHHFGGDYERIADMILQEVSPPK